MSSSKIENYKLLEVASDDSIKSPRKSGKHALPPIVRLPSGEGTARVVPVEPDSGSDNDEEPVTPTEMKISTSIARVVPTEERAERATTSSAVLERAKQKNASHKHNDDAATTMGSEGPNLSRNSAKSAKTATDSEGCAHKMSFKGLRKMKAREQLTFWFIFLQIAMLLLGNFAAKRLETAVLQLEVGTSGSLVAGVELMYMAKFNHMSNGHLGIEGEPLIQQYATSPDPENAEAVLARLQVEINSRQIEFSTLLDKDMRILVSSNTNRTGQLWDPSGIVSQLKSAHALSSNTTQIRMAATLTQLELLSEVPPLWAERADIESPALVGLHPYIASGDALVRYVATVITNTNGDTIGYLVSGDIMDGKLDVPGNFKLSLWGSSSKLVTDGFIGVYAADSHDVDKTSEHKGWRECSHAAIATLVAMDARTMTADVDPPISTLLDDAARKNGTAVATYADRETSYVYTAKLAPRAYIGPSGLAPPLETPVMLVQASYSPYWLTAWWSSFRYTILIFAIDIVALSLAIYIFILPLEKLGQRVREGKPLSATATTDLRHRKYWLGIVLLIPLVSFLLSVYNAVWSLQFFNDSEVSVSVKQTSMITLTYGIKVEQMRYGIIGLASSPTVVEFATNIAASTDPSSVSSGDIRALLKAQTSLRQLELVAFVGMDGMMHVNGNTDEGPGIAWDTPGRTVMQAIAYGNLVISNEILTYEEYRVLNATQWTKAYTPASPPSALHPENTKADVLVRFAATQVKGVNVKGASVVLGALVWADIINGMTYVPEYANALRQLEGFSAIYVRRDPTSDYQLVSSALTDNGESEVDFALPTDFLDDALTPVYNDPSIISTSRIKIREDNHVLTVRCAPNSYFLLSEGRLYSEAGPEAKCSILFVQSANEQFNEDNFRQNVVVQCFLIAAQLFKLIGLGMLLRLAFLPFQKIVLNKGMVRVRKT